MDRTITTPNALASLALTVNLMLSPSTSPRRDTNSIQDAFHIGNDDELFTPFGDEADKLRLPVHADARRLLHVGLRNFRDLVDLVGSHADKHRLAVDLDLDDDNARVGRILELRHAEANAQVRERNHVAAHVDHARNKGSGAGDPGHRHGIDDLAHEARIERELLLAETDHHDLHRAGLMFAGLHLVHHAASLMCCFSIFDCASATSCATSRISAAVPSPRMVAPEKIVTSECSLESDLITVWWLPMI